jgi:hypothetical protein
LATGKTTKSVTGCAQQITALFAQQQPHPFGDFQITGTRTSPAL